MVAELAALAFRTLALPAHNLPEHFLSKKQ